MTPAAQVADNGLDIKRHAAVRDGQIIAVIFNEKPARSAAGAWQPRGTRIEGADAVDETIGGHMGMAASDDAGAASGEQRPELFISDARIDSRAIISLR